MAVSLRATIHAQTAVNNPGLLPLPSLGNANVVSPLPIFFSSSLSDLLTIIFSPLIRSKCNPNLQRLLIPEAFAPQTGPSVSLQQTAGHCSFLLHTHRNPVRICCLHIFPSISVGGIKYTLKPVHCQQSLRLQSIMRRKRKGCLLCKSHSSRRQAVWWSTVVEKFLPCFLVEKAVMSRGLRHYCTHPRTIIVSLYQHCIPWSPALPSLEEKPGGTSRVPAFALQLHDSNLPFGLSWNEKKGPCFLYNQTLKKNS